MKLNIMNFHKTFTYTGIYIIIMATSIFDRRRNRVKKNIFSALLLCFLLMAFAANVNAYPGSGQSKMELAPVKIIEPTEVDKFLESGAIINPLHDMEAYVGEEAVFGGNCLSCHGGEDGANSPNQKFYNEITYDLIRIADGKSMKQEDGTLLFELDPNGGVVKYKLVVGLSKEAYDGGQAGGYHESLDQNQGQNFGNAISIDGKDFRALAGWHFALPHAVKMDLPYCMHIMEEGMSKIFEGDPNRVFSDINIAVDPNKDFQGGKGVLQIIAGTQAADPFFMKTYGTVLVEYKLAEGLPVEEGIAFDTLNDAIAKDNMIFVEHQPTEGDDAVAAMGTGINQDNENPVSKMKEPGAIFYGIIIALIIAMFIYGVLNKGRIS